MFYYSEANFGQLSLEKPHSPDAYHYIITNSNPIGHH